MYACRFLVLFFAALLGCSSAATKPPEHPKTPPTPVVVVPSVPQDPMLLVPPDAQVVAKADIDAIEGTASFGKWRAWAMRATCVSDADLTWLTAQTKRAVFAGSNRDGNELLLILDGTFSDPDRERALSLLDALFGEPKSATSPHTERAFAVLASQRASAVVLDGRFMVVGTPKFVSAAIGRTGDPPPASYADSQPFQRLAERLRCSASTGCLVATPDSRATRTLGKQLGSAGLGTTGRSVAAGAVGLAVDVAAGLRVQVASEMPSEAEASAAIKALNDWIWRMDVIARLAGLTEVLDEVKVSGSGAYVDLHAELAPPVLANVEERIEDMLGDEDSCTAQAAAGPTP